MKSNMKRKLIFLVAVVSVLVSAASVTAQVQKEGVPVAFDKQEKFDPTRDSARDIASGVQLAKKLNKRVLLDVGGEWCPWCKKLDKMFTTDAGVAKMLKDKYVVVKVNFSTENENKEVLAKYPKITGYPHLFVLDKEGKLLHSQDTGLLETGDHHDHDKVMTFLKKWAG
jgi:thioredoxin-related protein